MTERIAVTTALDEETARAEIYGLLARLYHSPPDEDLLARIRVAPTEAPAAGAYLEEPWRALVGSARAATQAAIADEYDALFGGVGKPDVYLYGSHYLAGFLNEHPLARLRGELAELGLARSDDAGETEDHFACVCEVMRWLIAGDDVAVCNLTRQQGFHARHVQPWGAAMCDAIAAHPRADFYARVAAFTRAFLDIEQQGFDLLD